MKPTRLASCLLALAALVTAGLPLAAAAVERLRNPNDDPSFGDAVESERFGGSLAIDGATVAVGSIEGRDDRGETTGSVHVFVRQDGQWRLQAKLLAPEGRAYEGFGGAVALRGDTLVVGAAHYSGDVYGLGAAYVFEREGGAWRLVQTLLPPQHQRSAFGTALALTDDTLAVGAPDLDVGDTYEAGGVVVFKHDAHGWHDQQTLTPPFPSYASGFGSSLLFAGNALLVGAPSASNAGGAVHSFLLANGHWTWRQLLIPLQTRSGDAFGLSFASDGHRLLVGAPGVYRSVDGSGSVIEWRRDGDLWVEADTLSIGGEPDLHYFGLRVAYHGGRWIVGALHAVAPSGYEPANAAIDLYTYTASGADLAQSSHTSLPYVGHYGLGLSALAADDDHVYAGLPERIVAPFSDAGEVRVFSSDGSESSINAGVTANFEQFGRAVAATPKWLLVGAPGERRRSAQSGAVFAYAADALDDAPDAVLADPDGGRYAEFGAALAVSADTVFVGAPGAGGGGSVRLYEHDGAQWRAIAAWTAPGASGIAAPGRDFGRLLAADASAVIVGGEGELTPTWATIPATYLYERAAGGWGAPVRLAPASSPDGQVLVRSVAIDGATAVVGSVVHVESGFPEPPPWEEDGAAQIFERTATGWTEAARFTRPPPAGTGEFGDAVAVSGAWVFVGAPLRREVHVYRRTDAGWQPVQVIASLSDNYDLFGKRLRVADGELWIGAPSYDRDRGGALYRYRESGGVWRLAESIAGAAGGRDAGLGSDFAIAGGTAYIGAPEATGYAAFVQMAGSVRVVEKGLLIDGFE